MSNFKAKMLRIRTRMLGILLPLGKGKEGIGRWLLGTLDAVEEERAGEGQGGELRLERPCTTSFSTLIT